MTDADVIVVGGGPAGSSTAFALARSGIDVLILDRAHFPRDKPCSEYLSPQASRILEEMCVLDAIERSGAARLSGMRVHAPGGEVIHGEFAGAARAWPPFRVQGLALRRYILDAILLDASRRAGARVREGVRVTDVVRDSAGRVSGVAVLDGERTETLRARLVVGADGLRSIVARRLGVAHAARWPRRVALVTHYQGVEGVGSCGEMHVDPHGYTGLADVGGGEINVAVVVPASGARALAGDAAGFLERWIAARPALARRFVGARRSGTVRATGPFASRVRRAWAPGAALVGDAADFFDPFTGEGMYAALRGGEMLAYYVFEALHGSAGRDADIALAAYDRARRNEFGGKWMVERAIALAVASPPLMNHAAAVLARRRDMADLLVGVTGDFVPAREVLRPAYWMRLLLPAGGGAMSESHGDVVPNTERLQATSRSPIVPPGSP